jgi:SAM-dependent methyltransferase
MQTISRPELRLGTYEDLAGEYYDSELHPTCANFREASRYLLVPWLNEFNGPNCSILEVGAGDSIVSEWLAGNKRTVQRFVAADLSWNMLRYSLDRGTGAELVVCDAQQLPFTPNSFDIVVSPLGDPYNTIQFWKEAKRVLKKNGHVLFTIPSFEWAQQFRNSDNHAEFQVCSGGLLAVASYVLSAENQCALISNAGLSPIRISHMADSQLKATPRSPKLRPGSVVSGYLARKERD